jgi:hypothetical protein
MQTTRKPKKKSRMHKYKMIDLPEYTTHHSVNTPDFVSGLYDLWQRVTPRTFLDDNYDTLDRIESTDTFDSVESVDNPESISPLELDQIHDDMLERISPEDLNKLSKQFEIEPVEPVAAKPVAAKPVAAKPVAAKPVAAKPVAAKPVAAKPVAAKPVAAKGANVSKSKKSGQIIASPGSKASNNMLPIPASKTGPVAKKASAKKGKLGKTNNSIEWGKTFHICPLLSASTLTKYSNATREMIANLPAMKDPVVGRELDKYINATKTTSLLEYMSMFSQNTNYPAFYLKWILELVPNVKYVYRPWTPVNPKLSETLSNEFFKQGISQKIIDYALTIHNNDIKNSRSWLKMNGNNPNAIKMTGISESINIFASADMSNVVISDKSCYESDSKKSNDVKNNILSHSYSEYILTVLFDVIARYRYVYGSDSTRILNINAHKEELENYIKEFGETAQSISCQTYTKTLYDILMQFPECNDPITDKCPYNKESLDILRKLVYRCIDNINVFKSTLSKEDIKIINEEISKELSAKNLLGTELDEKQKLNKNLIVFQKYTKYIQDILDNVKKSLGAISDENTIMSKQLPTSTQSNCTLFLGLLIRSLQEGNSDFIDTLSEDELVEKNGNMMINTTNKKLNIINVTNDMIKKYVPTVCKSGMPICSDLDTAKVLKSELSKKPPIPGKKAGPSTIVKKPIKKYDLSDKLTAKVMNNLAIETAQINISPTAYILNNPDE